MKVGIIQFDILWEEKEKNFLKVKKLINNNISHLTHNLVNKSQWTRMMEDMCS